MKPDLKVNPKRSLGALTSTLRADRVIFSLLLAAVLLYLLYRFGALLWGVYVHFCHGIEAVYYAADPNAQLLFIGLCVVAVVLFIRTPRTIVTVNTD